MNKNNKTLLDIVKNKNFILIVKNKELNKKDSEYFKLMVKAFLKEDNLNINDDLKNYLKNLFGDLISINKKNACEFIKLFWIVIKFYNNYVESDFWENPYLYTEVYDFKINKQGITKEYFNYTGLNHNTYQQIILDFQKLFNHFKFMDYFVYIIQLGLSFNLNVNLYDINDFNKKIGLYNFDNTNYNILKSLNYLFLIDLNENENNYFIVMDKIQFNSEKFEKLYMLDNKPTRFISNVCPCVISN
jgi:hypothetical protein